MTILFRRRLIEPRVSGDVRPTADVITNGRKLVLTIETVRSLRVRTHVRAGNNSDGAPCGGLEREPPAVQPLPVQLPAP